MSLEKRIEQLECREAVDSLMTAYGRCLDDHDWAGFGSLFAEDGELVSVGGVGAAIGPERIRAMFTEALKDVDADAFHVVTNEIIEGDGQRAEACAMWTYVSPDEKGAPRILQCGHYEDEVSRAGERWLFQRRAISRAIGRPPYRK
jgi:uncharacterized protein (TIGR02246 family)